MNKKISIWRLISNSLSQNIPVMLLYVLESKGSSPGRQGFFMAINGNGDMEGSIGGGIMEHKFVELAKQELKEGVRSAMVKKQIHDKSAATDQSGMICSGEQTIWLYPVKKNEAEEIDKLIASLEQAKNGTLKLSPQGISFTSESPARDFQFEMKSEKEWSYLEKTGYKNHLFIIGGGHCALAFSKLMRAMDFYITIYEEREDLHTVRQNEYAHEINIIDDYTGLSQLIPSGPHQYVVIMTFGYRSDDVALRALINKPFKYLGVLGSKTKMEKLFSTYREENVAEELLSRINTPIGLNINSETPEEIAVSIAAEIIKVKNT
jgi:xanthine dehydrogenase accessory factor